MQWMVMHDPTLYCRPDVDVGEKTFRRQNNQPKDKKPCGLCKMCREYFFSNLIEVDRFPKMCSFSVKHAPDKLYYYCDTPSMAF